MDANDADEMKESLVGKVSSLLPWQARSRYRLNSMTFRKRHEKMKSREVKSTTLYTTGKIERIKFLPRLNVKLSLGVFSAILGRNCAPSSIFQLRENKKHENIFLSVGCFSDDLEWAGKYRSIPFDRTGKVPHRWLVAWTWMNRNFVIRRITSNFTGSQPNAGYQFEPWRLCMYWWNSSAAQSHCIFGMACHIHNQDTRVQSMHNQDFRKKAQPKCLFRNTRAHSFQLFPYILNPESLFNPFFSCLLRLQLIGLTFRPYSIQRWTNRKRPCRQYLSDIMHDDTANKRRLTSQHQRETSTPPWE